MQNSKLKIKNYLAKPDPAPQDSSKFKIILLVTFNFVLFVLSSSKGLTLNSREANAAAATATSSAVIVQAKIDQSLTVSISGLGDNVAVNTGNSACQNSETTNTGNSSTSTAIDLARLKDTPATPDTQIGNLAAQMITVTTNARNGYVLSATSNGHLASSSVNFSLSDSDTPVEIPSGQNFFGIHPCGLDTDQALWTSESASSCSSNVSGSSGNLCKYAWPAPSSSLTLASDQTGPVGDNLEAGNGITTIQYAAGIDSTVPGGSYTTTIRYTITPTF